MKVFRINYIPGCLSPFPECLEAGKRMLYLVQNRRYSCEFLKMAAGVRVCVFLLSGLLVAHTGKNLFTETAFLHSHES